MSISKKPMRNKSPEDSSVQIKDLRARLFKAAVEIDLGDDILRDSKGSASPYEQMYDRHGVSSKRPRRQHE